MENLDKSDEPTFTEFHTFAALAAGMFCFQSNELNLKKIVCFKYKTK